MRDEMGVKIPYLYQRGESYYFRRTIPEEHREAIGRGREWIKSFGKVSDLSYAARLAELENRNYEDAIRVSKRIPGAPSWAEGVSVDTERFDYDLKYDDDDLHRGRVREAIYARAGVDSLIGEDPERLRRLVAQHAKPHERAALQGHLMLSEALAEDESLRPLKRDKHRRRGVEDFIEIVGDIPVNEVSREHVRKFIQAMTLKEYAPATIDRRRDVLRAVINRYYTERQMPTPPLFKGIEIPGEGDAKAKREPATDADAKAFAAYLLEKEAEGRVSKHTLAMGWLLISSTCGPGECDGILDVDLRLEDEVPHVLIRANSLRDLKTGQRDRAYPLVGHALRLASNLAVTKFKPDRASAVLNKHLKAALGEAAPTAYQFRHWMIDRLRDAGASPNDARYLSGHGGVDIHDKVYGASKITRERLRNLAGYVEEACNLER